MAIKAVRFHYRPTSEVLELLNTFRRMINDAIRIGLERRPSTRFQLITMVYQDFKKYGLHTHYILSACEVAFSILRNHKRRMRSPIARHLFLKLDSQSYTLNYLLLRIPTNPRQSLVIPLKAGEYQAIFLRDKRLKRGSITITAEGVVLIAFNKTVETQEPLGKIAWDVNEKSVIGASNDGEAVGYDLTPIANLRRQYSKMRAGIDRKTHKDKRTRRRLLSKYGKREKERAQRLLHAISKKIVQEAKRKTRGIVLERLKGIRYSHRRTSRESRRVRARLNRWSFYEFQRQIEYKAAWEGVNVERVSPRNTSKTCSSCGTLNYALKYEREWTCPNCGTTLDRDLNAALNILNRSRAIEAAPVRRSDEGLAHEGMVLHETITRSQEVKPCRTWA